MSGFAIDNGELDGLSPQMCFVLGYELAYVCERLQGPRGFILVVHSENADRIRNACRASGREYVLEYQHDDISEAWMGLRVESR